MLTLLKNLDCYTPKYIGKNDILICSDKIYKIQPEINPDCLIEKTMDCEDLVAFPGIIDQHVHITGGGGENGFDSHCSDIDIKEIFNAGVTTVVGLLGADSCTRSLKTLYAKAKALEKQGLTAYIYSGSYSAPPVTITGDIVSDLVFIDNCLGIGEVAISDHRSSHLPHEHLLKIASDIHLGSLLSGKAGVMHLHVGDGKSGLSPLLKIIENSDLPIEEFVPTHINRNHELFMQGVEYCKSGGFIDLTAGESEGLSVCDAVDFLIKSGLDTEKVTISSDSNGSIPGGGVSSIGALFDDIVACINNGINPETAFGMVTENVAKVLKLYPKKGVLRTGSDADILILNNDNSMNKLFIKGKMIINDGEIQRIGND